MPPLLYHPFDPYLLILDNSREVKEGGEMEVRNGYHRLLPHHRRLTQTE